MLTVRYWAAARAAAGVAEESLAASSCAAVIDLVSARDERLARVLAMSSLLVDGVRHDARDDTPLPEGAVVEVLPPFAGG